MPEVVTCTVYTFAELSDKAKDRARDSVRPWDVEDDWWDCIYDDAVRIGALMGIEISSTTHTENRLDPKDSRTWETVDISFSGFWSRGGGASFTGCYNCMPDAVAKIQAEAPMDEELHAIATELTKLQTTLMLQYGSTLRCKIFRSPRGELSAGEFGWDSEIGPDDALVDAAFEGLFRRFATWIYDQLEATYEFLTSDEHVDERLSEGDYRFDEDGTII